MSFDLLEFKFSPENLMKLESVEFRKCFNQEVSEMGRRLLPIALVALSVLGVVYCDFGLKISFIKQVELNWSIRDGVGPLKTASKSLLQYASKDPTKTLTKLNEIVTTLTDPIEKLLNGVLAAFSDNKTSPNTLGQDLEKLIKNARKAVRSATEEASEGLSMTIRASWYKEISDSLSALDTAVKNLGDQLNEMKKRANLVLASSTPVTSANVAVFIPSKLVSSATSSLHGISQSVSKLASVVNSILMERISAASYTADIKTVLKVSATSNANLGSILGVAAANSTVTTIQNITAVISTVSQKYAAIKTAANKLSGVTLTSFNSFVAAFTEEQSGFFAVLTTQQNTLTSSTNLGRVTAETLLKMEILSVASSMTDASLVSASPVIDSCTKTHMLRLVQTNVSILRLSTCTQKEIPVVKNLALLYMALDDDIRLDVLRMAGQFDICSPAATSCYKVYFNAFEDYSPRVSVKIERLNQFVLEQTTTVKTRYNKCIMITVADVENNLGLIATSFQKCLGGAPKV